MKLKQYKYDGNKGADEIAKILFSLNSLLPLPLKSHNEQTQLVKVALIKLGHTKDKKVYANRLSCKRVLEINQHLMEIGRLEENKQGFKNTEWLYDVHWYTDVENESYKLKSFDLACEIEWNKVRNIYTKEKERIPVKDRKKKEYKLSGLKYDFQKLLVNNAKINLFITKLVNKEEVDSFFKYCNTVLNTYTQLSSSSKFLVVCFVKDCIYYFQ